MLGTLVCVEQLESQAEIMDHLMLKVSESRPDPHPIDFDWRFLPETVDKLCELIHSSERTLLLGTPSLATHLNLKKDKRQKLITLVDRQPLPQALHQIQVDIGVHEPLKELYQVAIVDSPWYLSDIKRWLSWASQSVVIGGEIYCSIWPESTRPEAIKERNLLFSWLRKWSDFTVHEGCLSYERPHFEQIAQKSNPNFNIEKRWVNGDLICVKLFKKLPLTEPLTRNCRWLRYIIGKIQLAVKLDDISDNAKIGYVSNTGWVWPHISRRAPGRDRIGLWSSDNLVATLEGSDSLISKLDQYLGLKHSERQLDNSTIEEFYYDFFKSWGIPESCPEKVIKWTHQN